MSNSSQTGHARDRIQSSLDRFSSPALLFPCLVVLLSCIDLVGWGLHSSLLTSMIPHSSTMKPNTALSLLLLAIACLARRRDGRSSTQLRCRAAVGAASFALLISCGTLFEYASGIDLRIDQLLYFVPLDGFGDPAGRMALGTATFLTLTGFALVFLDRTPAFTTWMLLAVNGMATSILISFIFNRGPLFGVAWLRSVAVHTAMSLLFLAIAALSARPDREPVASLLRFTCHDGKEAWIALVFTVVSVLVALPAVIAMRTGFADAGLTFVGVLLVLLTLEMFGQFFEGRNLKKS